MGSVQAGFIARLVANRFILLCLISFDRPLIVHKIHSPLRFSLVYSFISLQSLVQSLCICSHLTLLQSHSLRSPQSLVQSHCLFSLLTLLQSHCLHSPQSLVQSHSSSTLPSNVSPSPSSSFSMS